MPVWDEHLTDGVHKTITQRGLEQEELQSNLAENWELSVKLHQPATEQFQQMVDSCNDAWNRVSSLQRHVASGMTSTPAEAAGPAM